jgi:hypothetical protein
MVTRVERVVLGLLMTLVAWFLERRLERIVRR